MPSAQLNGAWLISLSNETNTKSVHLDYSAFSHTDQAVGVEGKEGLTLMDGVKYQSLPLHTDFSKAVL